METTKILGRRRYYKNGSELFEAWYNSLGKRYIVIVVKHGFIRGKRISYEDHILVFDYAGKTYRECGIDHFNAHLSGFRDKSAIYGVYLRKVE